MSVQRFVRFHTEDRPEARWGRREGSQIVGLTQAPWRAPQPTDERLQGSEAILLAPAEPTKILAFGYNYRDLFEDEGALTSDQEAHFTAEGFEPLVFLKGPNCLSHPGQPVHMPADVDEVWVEVEVAAVIGVRCRNLPDGEAARAVVAGLTIGNDITALNVLGRDWHLARSKALDGFCPLGPELVTGLDDADLALSTTVDGTQTQSSSTRFRILDSHEAVALASRLMTLEPGDVVLTGTPAGARGSLVRPGSVAVLEVQGIGQLVTPIAEARVP